MSFSGGQQADHTQRPDDWIAIAAREHENIGKALKGKVSHDHVCGHAILCIEAILKAILWKKEKWERFPEKSDGKYRFLYYHSLQEMIKRADLLDELLADNELAASWQTIVAASMHARYSPVNMSGRVAWAVAKSVRNLDKGIYRWLLNHYQQMT